MGRIFGTDGARGLAGVDITPDLAMDIGRGYATVIKNTQDIKRPRILIGKDTRISCDMLEAGVATGLCSVGADVLELGVLPTPAVAYLIKQYGADGAVMISASHNAYPYNGIKLFDRDGYKLDDGIEAEIESVILDDICPYAVVDDADFGTVQHIPSAHTDYVRHLASTAEMGPNAVRVLIDCANGSASATAGELMDMIRADYTLINCEPNGVNINENCGSTCIESMTDLVREGGYDLGLAFDGDADRCFAVDENGEIVDGDMLLAIFGCYLLSKDKLSQRTIVSTVMSNLGFMKFGQTAGINIETTKVGDRYVIERMLEKGYNLGGEQSGHITFTDYMPTGDGQLCAVQLLSIMSSSGLKLSQLKAVMKKYPQVLKNVRASRQVADTLEENRPVQSVIEQCSAQLGDRGRILVRPSGTEPLIRVMVEGESEDEITEIAEMIAAKIEESR